MKKILIRSLIVFIVCASLLFLWLTRDPTTQLIDASGKALTAGSAADPSRELARVSPFEEANALIKGRKFADAKEALLRIIENSDNDGEACILLCTVSTELKDVKAALDYGLKATKLLPESAEAHLAYAKALGMQIFTEMQSITGMVGAMAHLGHFKTEADRVIELDPEDTRARAMLVFYNLAPKPFGNIDKAIQLSREIELRDPITGKQLLAMCHVRKQETEQAIALLLEGINQYPEECSFRVALADIYAEEKRFDAADTEYVAARRCSKNEAYYRSLYGQARMRIQHEFEPERAVELLDEFIADEPEGEGVQSVAHACWRKGNALEKLGRREDARKAYEDSLRREPGLKLAEKAIQTLSKLP